MKTAYYPLTDKTNKYVKLIYDSITKADIDVIGANYSDDNFDFEIINLNWYESIFKRNYFDAVKEYFKKIKYIKELKSKDIKIVWTVHNKVPHDGKYVFLAKKLMKILIKESDAIIIHCKDTKDVLTELNHLINIDEKVCYIPHPNYEGAYDEKNINFKEELGLKDDTVFLFVGQIRPYKNVELIIEAAKRLKDKKVTFVIAGNPNNRFYKKEIESLIGDSKNIKTLFKYIEDDEIVPLIKCSDAVILPYDLESSLNSGVAILAFTHGKTVICPSIGTLNDIDEDTLFYSYNYKDSDEHKESLISAINACYEDSCRDKNILANKGSRLKEIMKEDYNLRLVSNKYKEVYEKLGRGLKNE